MHILSTLFNVCCGFRQIPYSYYIDSIRLAVYIRCTVYGQRCTNETLPTNRVVMTSPTYNNNCFHERLSELIYCQDCTDLLNAYCPTHSRCLHKNASRLRNIHQHEVLRPEARRAKGQLKLCCLGSGRNRASSNQQYEYRDLTITKNNAQTV